MKFILLINDQKMKNRGSQVHQNLIDIIWVLVYSQSLSGESLPLIPRLLEKLYNYQRDEALKNDEYLKLYQINLWIEDQIA